MLIDDGVIKNKILFDCSISGVPVACITVA